MKKLSWMFAFCLMLIVTVWALVFSQVGADKRPTTPPKTSAPKPKRTPVRKSSTSRSTPKPSPQPTNSNATAEAANERTYWESIRNSIDPEDFRAYLKKYPNGVYADLARNRLSTLETAAREEAARKEEAKRKEEEAKKEEAKRKEEEAKKEEARRKEEEAKKRPGAVVKNSLGMEFVYVPAGTFMMGSSAADVQRLIEQEKRKDKHTTGQRFKDEMPQHQVTIREGFYMGKYEVTQAQWQAIMGYNPSSFKGDNLPVETVKWDDTQEFIRRMNAKGDGYIYRLPSEA